MSDAEKFAPVSRFRPEVNGLNPSKSSQNRLNVYFRAIDMRKLGIGLVENLREVRSREQNRIHRQLLRDSRRVVRSSVSPFTMFM